MRRTIPFALALLSSNILASCGGSMNSMNPSGGVPMSLTIGDTPPSGVAVLFFEASITGASLQPSDSKKQAVSLMTTPVDVEFGHLQTDTAFLDLGNVAPDTYQSLTLTFGNAMMTIVNHSGAAIGSCADNSVCELTPNFNPSMATLSSTPFPITISQNSVVGIRLDFNVDSSVQSDLSINPTVTIKKFIQRQDSDDKQEMERLDEIDGQVTAVGSNQFTLMNERSGQSFTISVDSTTQFHMVVFNEEPAMSSISEGSSVVVTIQPNAMFQVGREEMGEDGGFSIPGLSFASGADLLVGQDVQIRPGTVSSSGGTTTVTTDLVRLWPSQITGQVGNISTDSGRFTLTGLSPLFTGATPPITTINVITLSGMNFIDFSGMGSLSNGSTVTVRGLLFNTAGTPTLVTRTMREDHGGGD